MNTCTTAVIVRVLLLALTLALPVTGHAASGPWATSEVVDARLVSAVEGTGALQAVPVGIELRLKNGWKTYWRSPGEAGLPPTVDWAGSGNLASAVLSYPAPHRFEISRQQTYGYKEQVVFPIKVAPTAVGQPLELKAALDILVCEKICVPQSLALTLAVPAGDAVPGAEAQLLGRFAAQVPLTGEVAGLSLTGASVIGSGDKQTLQVSVVSSEPLRAPDLFAEVEPTIIFGQPDIALTDGGRRATFSFTPRAALPAGTTLAGRSATFTLVEGERAIERTVVIGEGQPGSLLSWAATNGTMLAVALLGGLILNLMPCVLPVLSIKLMSVISHGDAPPAAVRRNFLATAAGIVFSMLAIAAVLIAIKAAGGVVGWGTQFQQPVFVAIMAVIVTLFACNMWGLFEIVLPPSLSNFAGSVGGDSLLGNFAIGAFATLLATPCSAPFVGTAVGFALAGGPGQIVPIFAALGLGLAAPYLAVAAVPRLARSMPRPGRWMVRLRQGLSLALAATVAWLLTILPPQIGMAATLVTTGLLVALIAALALSRDGLLTSPLPGRMAAVALALAIVGLPLIVREPAPADASASRIAWASFDRDRVRSLVSQGKTVFVDVTAQWCAVCKTNKKFVLDTPDVEARLQTATVAMRADWTSPDPKISALLASFGRYGIPFNVVFGPGAPSGVLLPELLTRDAIFAAIDTASGKTAAAIPMR